MNVHGENLESEYVCSFRIVVTCGSLCSALCKFDKSSDPLYISYFRAKTAHVKQTSCYL